MLFSDVAKKQLGKNGADRPEVCDAYGRVRMICVHTEIKEGESDSTICLWHFPAGRVRVLSGNLDMQVTAGTISIGPGPYIDMGGRKVVPEKGLFQAATATRTLSELSGLKPEGFVMQTTSGFDLLVETSGKFAKGDIIKGLIYFTID